MSLYYTAIFAICLLYCRPTRSLPPRPVSPQFARFLLQLRAIRMSAWVVSSSRARRFVRLALQAIDPREVQVKFIEAAGHANALFEPRYRFIPLPGSQIKRVLSASLRSGTGLETVAVRHPVMPIADGLGCGFVGIDGSPLR